MDLNLQHKPVLVNEVLQGFKNHFSNSSGDNDSNNNTNSSGDSSGDNDSNNNTNSSGDSSGDNNTNNKSNSKTNHNTNNNNICILDGTFGRGGHYKAFKESFGDRLKYIALDQDKEAIAFAEENFSEAVNNKELEIFHTNFSNFEQVERALKGRNPEAVFLDLGVSSPQLNDPKRGFSFYHEGPLDMRMNQDLEVTAADILNQESLEELRKIFLTYGEIYAPQRLLNAIDEKRSDFLFLKTIEFSSLIEKVCGWKKKGNHPATQYFQALRLYVNKELESLDEALKKYQEILIPGGLFAVITFHSLEDRRVKYSFKQSKLGKPINKKVIKPTDKEVGENRRSRSAKLRFFKKEEGFQ